MSTGSWWNLPNQRIVNVVGTFCLTLVISGHETDGDTGFRIMSQNKASSLWSLTTTWAYLETDYMAMIPLP